MKNLKSDSSLRIAARLAGFMLLLAFIVPTLNWAFVLSGFIDKDNALATAQNIMANEFVFRLGITIELFMAAFLIILGWALYRLLKAINNHLALLALCLKVVEASIMAVTVLIPYIAIQFLSEESYFIGVIFNSHTTITSITMVFLGMDMMLFTYLLFKSDFIPKLLAGFGFLSFALIFIHALMSMLAPDFATMTGIQMVFWIPSGLFELICGSWLLITSLKAEK